MDAPSDKDVLDAVRIVQLSIGDDNAESKDAKTVLDKVKENHFLWKKLTIDRVQSAIDRIESERIPPYVPPAELYHFDFDGGIKPYHSIDKDALTKSEFVGIHHSQGGAGSSGVFVVMAVPVNEDGVKNEKEMGAFVLKELSIKIFEEVLASEIFIELGMYAPRMRPMARDEFKDVTWKLRQAKLSVHGTCAQLHEQRTQDRGGYLMTYLPRCKELGEDEDREAAEGSASASASTSKKKGHWTDSSDDTKKKHRDRILHDMGRILAIDMSINNTDRFPFIWSHRGNRGNVLLMIDSPNAASIDQTYNPILESEENLKSYLRRVFEGTLEAKKKDTSGKHIATVRKFIESCTRVDIGDDGIGIVQDGIAETARQLAKDSEGLFKRAWDRTKQSFKEFLWSTSDSTNPVQAIIRKSIASEQAYKGFFCDCCKQMDAALNAQ